MRHHTPLVGMLVLLGFGLLVQAQGTSSDASPSVSPQPAANQPATSQPSTSQPSATLPDKHDKNAAVRLVTQGKLQPLRPGVKIWPDAKYIFLKIPTQLRGARFIQNSVSKQPKLVMEVVREGYLVIAAPNSGKDKFSRLTDAGWAIIALEEEFVDTCDTQGWTLFRKECKLGKQLILEVQKYHAPFVVLFN